MRILIVSSYLPYPLINGGHVRLYNLIKQLSKKHSITLVCEKRSYQTEEDVTEVKKFCEEVHYVHRKKQWSITNIAKTSMSLQPFLLVGHTLPTMTTKIRELLREKTFDVIHVETFYVFQNLPKTYLPIVLAEHNIEYQVYRKYVAVAPLPLRPMLLGDIQKIKYWEKKSWQKATKLIAVSQSDKAVMKREDVVLVANGVDLKQFSFQLPAKKLQAKEKRILFMGDFTWLQNRQAVDEIVSHIWPRLEEILQKEYPQEKVKLWIVGKHIPEHIKAMHGNNIIVDENAPSQTEKIYQKSFLLLAPIRVGGGTSYKILESMASGVPVVTTQLGVQGLGALDGKEALVAEDVDGMVSHVVHLFKDTSLYERLATHARQLIEKNYSWEKIADVLESVYKEAIRV